VIAHEHRNQLETIVVLMELMWANRCLLQDRRAEAERRVRATQELDQRAQGAAEAFRQVRDPLLTEESEKAIK